MNITTISKQWFSRPADERHVNLKDLFDVTKNAKVRSTSTVAELSALSFEALPETGGQGLTLRHENGTQMGMTNYAFQQLSAKIGAPSGFIGSLPANIAADALNWKLQSADKESGQLLLTNYGTKENKAWQARAFTGPGYGRVYNADIVGSMGNVFGWNNEGPWKVPGEFGKEITVTKENTTIYGSDRDICVFLADEINRIEIPNRRDGKKGSLARGFYVLNGECGNVPLVVASFLFDYACSNRTIWGVEGFKTFRAKHTSGAPLRWIEELQPVLADYHNAKASGTEKILIGAQAMKIDALDFLTGKGGGFNSKTANLIMAAHKTEEDRPIETAWDATVGITAFAKSIPFNDERIKIEAAAGKILDLVAKAA